MDVLAVSFLLSPILPWVATLAQLGPLWEPGTATEGLAWWRLAVGLAFLGYASVSDILWRRVKNLTWVLLAAVAAVFLLMDVTRAEPSRLYLVLIPVFILLAYLLWYAHLIYGGADAKALMAIAVLVPYPIALAPGLPVAVSIFPGFVTVLVDSLLIFLLIPLFYFAVNLATGHVSFPAMFLARRMSLEKALDAKVWVMDRLEGEGAEARVVLDYFPSSAVAYDEKMQRLADHGVSEVWATPKVPFMIPLFLGFLAAHLVGDVLPWIVVALQN